MIRSFGGRLARAWEVRRTIRARLTVWYVGLLAIILLTLARADAGPELLVREPLDLNDSVDAVMTALAPLANTHGVALERGARPAALVEGDQTRLTQLLPNLIDNGIKDTPAATRVGQGTTFTLALPRFAPPKPQPVPAAGRRHPGRPDDRIIPRPSPGPPDGTATRGDSSPVDDRASEQRDEA